MLPGPSEWLVIFGIVFLLFGASKLPKLGGAIGEGIRNFKKGLNPDEEEEAQGKQKPSKITPGQSDD